MTLTSTHRLTLSDGVSLWREHPLELGRRADAERKRRFPENYVTFIKDRVINYTNICITDCGFCAFYRPPKIPKAIC